MRIGLIAAVLCAGGLLAGCAVREPAPAPTPVPEAPPRLDSSLASRLAERHQALQSLRSLARVSYRASRERGAFDAAVLVRRPHRLRLEAFSVVGAALIVTVDDGEVTGFLPSQARYYRGRTSRENLFRATRVLLELDEMAALLMGLPPVDSGAEWAADALALRRTRPDGGADILTFDPEGKAPTGWRRVGPDGKLQSVATFEDFSDTPFGRFPLKITLETPSLQRFYQIRYDMPELNVALPESHFVQKLPEGAVRVPLPSPTG